MHRCTLTFIGLSWPWQMAYSICTGPPHSASGLRFFGFVRSNYCIHYYLLFLLQYHHSTRYYFTGSYTLVHTHKAGTAYNFLPLNSHSATHCTQSSYTAVLCIHYITRLCSLHLPIECRDKVAAARRDVAPQLPRLDLIVVSRPLHQVHYPLQFTAA